MIRFIWSDAEKEAKIHRRLEQLPYSLDLAPSDCHLFRMTRKLREVVHFLRRRSARSIARVSSQPAENLLLGRSKLTDHWVKCIEKEVDYVAK